MTKTMTLTNTNYLQKLITIQTLLQQYSTLKITIEPVVQEVGGHSDDLKAYTKAMRHLANRETLSLDQMKKELGYTK